MSKRQCKGTNRQGEPCKAAPLRSSDYCRAHDRTRPDDDRFGSPAWSARAGASEKPRSRKPFEVMQQIIEADVMAFLEPKLRILGREVRFVDGEPIVTRRPEGGAKLHGTSKDGEVVVSDYDDLAAMEQAVERTYDRVYGKARQAMEVSGPDGGPVTFALLAKSADDADGQPE